MIYIIKFENRTSAVENLCRSDWVDSSSIFLVWVRFQSLFTRNSYLFTNKMNSRLNTVLVFWWHVPHFITFMRSKNFAYYAYLCCCSFILHYTRQLHHNLIRLSSVICHKNKDIYLGSFFLGWALFFKLSLDESN